jgi:flagellar basal body-associated protein FliL
MKKIFIISSIVVLIAVGFYIIFSRPFSKNSSQNNKQTNNTEIKNMSHIITIKTNMGEIRFATYDADSPNTVNNFITLAKKGF